MSATADAAITEEQEALDAAHVRRLEVIEELTGRLAAPAAEDSVAAVAMRTTRGRLAEMEHAEAGLVFGRLDDADGAVRRIGRVGLPAAEEDEEPLVLDWRAAAARPFYTATAVDPHGQVRRRHIRTEGTEVVGVDDELLEGEAGDDLVGEGALLAALDEGRTGRMGTAVATLQREQDAIVRASARGALVVQGGPGTGKTVVALHRVAYLLFAHPELARAGVLVLGPSQRFLDYIAQVLPALGETAVVSATCETLLPGVRASRRESRDLAEIKGRALWQQAITDLVSSLHPTPTDLTIRWEGEQHVVPGATVQRLLTAARSGRAYNPARRVFINHLVDVVTDLVVDRAAELLAQTEEGLEEILNKVDSSLARHDDRGARTGQTGRDVDGELSETEVEELRERIREDRTLVAQVHQWWPDLEPADVLEDLLTDVDALARFAPDLTGPERRAVAGEPTGRSASDIALLDAVADELGELDAVGVQGEFVADRAVARRDWVYGHVVVDEAQELSPMEWRMVARRSPRHSITAVGDIDQSEAPHGHTTWEATVGDALGQRWRQGRLTICYRTPREVMDLTAEVLAAAGSSNEPPRAVRSSGVEPWVREIAEADLPEVAASCAAELADRWSGGSVGVVAPANRVVELSAATEVPVLTAVEAKGLEWDATLVVDPDGIAAEPRGLGGLYVALTRCTQELGRLVVG